MSGGFRCSQEKKGRKPRTINGDIAVIRSLLKRAEQLGAIIVNPAAKLKKLPLVKKAPRFYSKEELESTFKQIDPGDLPYFKLLLFTGIRRSELFHLTWDKVNLKRKALYVGRKTYKERAVPLNEKAIKALNEIKSMSKGEKVYHYTSIDTLSHTWLNAIRKADLHGTLHDIRHTFASQLVMAGVDIYTVSKLLGHSNVTTTEIYSHLTQDHLQQAAGKISNLLD